MTPLPLSAANGDTIAATLFEAGHARAAVLIAGAMGVKQSYYAAFAEHLAGRGLTTLTLDYRGIGRSPAGREKDLTLLDWARVDLGVGLAKALTLAPKVAVVGHSLGGQVLPLVPGAERLSAALLVAAQSGYWRHWPLPYRPAMFLLWNLTLPAFTRLFGKGPMRLFGQGEDLPKGVALQWARWGRHPDYLASEVGHEPFARMRMPTLALSLEDDRGYAPWASVEALLSLWTAAPKEHRVVVPKEHGLSSIGHFGFFRATCKAAWPVASDWLLRVL